MHGFLLDMNVLIVPLAIVLIILSFRFAKKRINLYKFLISVLLIIYIHLVIGITMFPIIVGFSRQFETLPLSQRIKLLPFVDVIQVSGQVSSGMYFKMLLKNIGGNILLFMPLGFLLPILYEKFNSFKKILLLGFFGSLCVELTQLLIGSIFPLTLKIADIDDLILNTLGCILGYLIYKFSCKFINYNKLKKSINKQKWVNN